MAARGKIGLPERRRWGGVRIWCELQARHRGWTSLGSIRDCGFGLSIRFSALDLYLTCAERVPEVPGRSGSRPRERAGL